MTAGLTSALPAGTRQLRDAFGRFGTGVAVVIAGSNPSVAAAVTINSFVSVSLEPPLVSFSLAARARCLANFLDAREITISVLRHEQKSLAANFARPSTARWVGLPLASTAGGQLIVRDPLAAFECVPERQVPAGDHVILVLRIRHIHLGATGPPLLFFSSGYGSFLPDNGARDDWERASAAMGWG
ncbi:MAG TPA: flavin reductase family protein [Steroidobacteraceae bacterium]|nr:flavin reductase family protein [Steroidobacteraceae bacterium]